MQERHGFFFRIRCLCGKKKARMRNYLTDTHLSVGFLMENVFLFIIKHRYHLKNLTGVMLIDLCKYLLLWSRCFTQKSCWLASSGNCYSQYVQKPLVIFGFSVLPAHLLRPGMAAAPTDQYHNKVTHRHYLLLLTDRDSGHYQLP